MNKIRFKLRGKQSLEEATIDDQGFSLLINESSYNIHQLPWDVPVDGTIYGTLYNYKETLKSQADQFYEEPYKVPPKAPILYIKPANTFIGYNMPIPLPKGVQELEVGAALGIVIGRTAKKVKQDKAYDYISGYTIVNDISIPHKSVYRPAISQKSRDGFCPIGPWIVEKQEEVNPDNMGIKVFINEELRQENTTANLVRNIPCLIADITEFMTLNAGDTLLVGIPPSPPLVKAGDRIRIEIEHIGYLENTIVHEDELVLGVKV
ncbi:fumarylacetoacetate hydrolase family protein [Heyndrickxia sp. NPDC080065]|uniref:fumarylacetoacetate hydrolase family protein n=1 Tax=Heyndrickxia sp. NPDC080065 TaxID=3390568 RepID=UPI003CFCD016